MTDEDQKNHLAKPKRGLLNHSQGLLYLSAVHKLTSSLYSSILNLSAFCDDTDKKINYVGIMQTKISG